MSISGLTSQLYNRYYRIRWRSMIIVYLTTPDKTQTELETKALPKGNAVPAGYSHAHALLNVSGVN